MFNKKHKAIEGITEVKLPKELLSFWKKVESLDLENRDFYYKHFGKIIPMSPDRMNQYSNLAPLNSDRYAFFNPIYSLTKSGKITKEEEQKIVSNSNWDPYVKSINLKYDINNFCKSHYIKYGIPFATSGGSTETVFLGYTESKNLDGVFYYNGPHQKFPIFICKTLEEFAKGVKEEKSNTETLVQLLGDQFCYRFQLNLEFDFDDQEVDQIFQFISRSFQNTFDREFNLSIDHEFVGFDFEYRGFQRYHKFTRFNLRNSLSLQMVVMALNNSITEFDGFFINNYRYSLTDDTIQLLHKDQAVKYIRSGLIKPYSKNPIPQLAYTSKVKKPKKYEAELLDMIKDKNWSQIEIDRFIDIYGDPGFNK